MINIDDIIKELEDKLGRTVSVTELFSNDILNFILRHHLINYIPFGERQNGVSLGKVAFFYKLPCKTYTNKSVIKIVDNGLYKRDGSFRPPSIFVNTSVARYLLASIH